MAQGRRLTQQPHCPACSGPLASPSVRVMPDGVAEYRCPSCSYQIPMVQPTQLGALACGSCVSGPVTAVLRGVDSSGLLNLVTCEGCGVVLGRYWGLL